MLDEMKPQLAKCIESEKHLGELEIQNASNTHELIKCHDDNKNMQERPASCKCPLTVLISVDP